MGVGGKGEGKEGEFFAGCHFWWVLWKWQLVWWTKQRKRLYGGCRDGKLVA